MCPLFSCSSKFGLCSHALRWAVTSESTSHWHAENVSTPIVTVSKHSISLAVPRPYTTLVGFFKCATSKCQLPEAGTTLATLLIHNILAHCTMHVHCQPVGQYYYVPAQFTLYISFYKNGQPCLMVYCKRYLTLDLHNDNAESWPWGYTHTHTLEMVKVWEWYTR